MYFITLSETIGTNSEKIARAVAGELKYAYFGEEELLEAASQTGFFSDIKNLDEKAPSLLDRLFSERQKIYLDRLQSVIYEVAKKGNTVFFGRGSQFLLHSFDCAFHILITGSMEKRVQRVMEEKGVAKEVAEKMISRSDHDKRAFVRFAYDDDWLNYRLYDLLINTDKLSLDAAVQMIVHGAKSDGIKSCGIDSVQLLGKLSLNRKIESALLEAGLMRPHLFFTVEEPDSVMLYGIVDSPLEKEEIEQSLKKIKQIKKVKNDLVVFSKIRSGV